MSSRIVPERGAEIAREIMRMRKAAGLTQVELAARAGVGLRFVRELEGGKPTVRLDKLLDVLSLFGCGLTVTRRPS